MTFLNVILNEMKNLISESRFLSSLYCVRNDFPKNVILNEMKNLISESRFLSSFLCVRNHFPKNVILNEMKNLISESRFLSSLYCVRNDSLYLSISPLRLPSLQADFSLHSVPFEMKVINAISPRW